MELARRIELLYSGLQSVIYPTDSASICLEGVLGLEPKIPASKADVLPLHYTSINQSTTKKSISSI